MSKTGSAFTYAQPPLSGGCHFLSLEATDQAPALRVWMNKPQGEAPAGGWPVLIILDGESYFTPAAEIMQRLSKRTAKTRIVPMMVVGIAPEEGADRVAAYAFVAGEGVANPQGTSVLARIREALVPVLVGEGADASRITLAGHSMSGLFVLEALAKNAGFNRYAAISPSLWWNPAIKDALNTPSDNLLLAVGELEETKEAAPTQIARGMVSNLVQLGALLDVAVDIGLNEDHGSVVYSVLPKVLRFASQ